MLRGEMGEPAAQAMRLLEAIGKAYGAERLIKVRSAHVSGISYNTIGEAGLGFLQRMALDDGRCKALTTINPAGMELDDPGKLGISRDFAEKQFQIIRCFENFKARITCTCTPYLSGNNPLMGDPVAWSESSAVIFVNSVIGASSNREGAPSSLASALTGRTPYYGYHLEENRRPNVEVSLESDLRTDLDFSLFGYVIGEKVVGVPFICGGAARPSLGEIKIFGAAAAASGDLALYHWDNLTPESRRYKTCLDNVERVSVDRGELEDALDRLSTGGRADAICLGCPHLSLSELGEIASLVKGKRLRRPLLCFTSRMVYQRALKKGFIGSIKRAGGKVIRDTCMVVSPLRESGIDVMETNSCKAAYYAPNLNGVSVSLSDMRHSIQEALKTA